MTRLDDEATAMQARIGAALDKVECHHGVRVLLAVESGSRAWRFPSRDSDWDVRFLYIRPLAAYLAIEPPDDVIGYPLIDGLDLSGWDVRKALGLLVRSNAVVLEWLRSPVRYRRDAGACEELAELAEEAMHLPAIAYHYDRLARRHWMPREQRPTRLKTLFYALRPALALAWMRAYDRSPPMDLPTLMAGLDLAAGVREAIEALRAQKLAATESDAAPRRAAIEEFLSGVLATPVDRPAQCERSRAVAAANRVFLRLLGESATLAPAAAIHGTIAAAPGAGR